MKDLLISIFRGFLIGVGFVLALYLCSKISLFGISGSVKEISNSIGQMFIDIAN